MGYYTYKNACVHVFHISVLFTSKIILKFLGKIMRRKIQNAWKILFLVFNEIYEGLYFIL